MNTVKLSSLRTAAGRRSGSKYDAFIEFALQMSHEDALPLLGKPAYMTAVFHPLLKRRGVADKLRVIQRGGIAYLVHKASA